MTASVAFNYMPTTNAAGAFNTNSAGDVQGMFRDDPAIRYQLSGGYLSSAELIPMWGGVAISEAMRPNPTITGPNGQSLTGPDNVIGGAITRATQIATGTNSLTGFSVFNQAYGMVITPQSSVPLAGSGMQVNFFRMGSGARIVVACAATLSAITADPINQPVSWDFSNHQLIPYVAAYASLAVNSATYTSATGILALTFLSAPLGAGIGSGANGVYISLSGLTTSVGSAANVNGDFPITGTASSGTVVSVQATPGLGAITINGTTGTLAAGGGALPVQVLEILIGNSMVVNYNANTGFANWLFAGSVAVIKI